MKSVEAYRATSPWNEFGNIEGLPVKCAKPSITFVDGKISAVSETEEAICHISYQCDAINGDATDNVTPTIQLKVTAYATAEGYVQSEIATVTFDLTNAGDMNGDGKLSIEDVTKLINKVLKK